VFGSDSWVSFEDTKFSSQNLGLGILNLVPKKLVTSAQLVEIVVLEISFHPFKYLPKLLKV